MSVENPFEKNDNPLPKEIAEWNETKLQERHDTSKENATELQNSVAKNQEAKLGIALRQLMDRTGDNPELVNSLNGFLDALEHQAGFGDSDKQLSEARAEDLAKFLEETAKALRFTVGHDERPSNIEIDLSEWELNKK